MSRATTALAVYEIPGRTRGSVRVHSPASGKASHRVVWTSDAGRQVERTRVGFEAACAEAHRVAVELASTVPTEGRRAGQPTLGEMLDSYLDGAGRSPQWTSHNSSRRFRQVARRILQPEDYAVTADVIVGDPDLTFLRRVMAHAQELGCAPGGREYAMAGLLLKTTLDAADRVGMIDLPDGNPMARIDYRARLPRASARSRELRNVEYVSEQLRPPADAVNALIAAADDLAGEAYGTALGVGGYGGLRLGEILAVRAEQVLRPDLVAAGGLHVDRQLVEMTRAEAGPDVPLLTFGVPKWGSVRTTWVAPHVHGRLVELARAVEREKGPHGLLFAAPRGGAMSRSNFRSRVFVPAAVAAGWPRGEEWKRGRVEHPWQWTLHNLRHGYANYALKDARQPLIFVAEWLGHDDVRVTARMYERPEIADIAAATSAVTTRLPVRGTA